MPLYEYRCATCGHRFEIIQKFSDPPAATCPACGGPVEKLLSSPAIQFKGSGWYITDYARKGEKEKTEGADPAKTTDGGKDKSAPAGDTTSSKSATSAASSASKDS